MEENIKSEEPNLSDIIGKFSDILKEKNIKLEDVMQNNDENTENSSGSDFNIDIETLFKLKDLLQKMNDNSNPRNRLLCSLKPFLKDSRKTKLDEYIKIANLLVIMNILTDMNSLYLILIIILLTK